MFKTPISKEMFRKKFSDKDFKKNDPIAREIATALYDQMYGVNLVSNSADVYGADLISTDNGALVECEVRNSWKTGKFPFKDYTISERKLKYGPCDVVTISDDHKHAVVAKVETIFKHKANIVKRRNRLTGDQLEPFICIPVSELEYFEIKQIGT